MSRPAAVTYDKTRCLAAKIKPQQQKVSGQIQMARIIFQLKTGTVML